MARWALIIAIEDYPKISTDFNKTLPGTNKAAQDFLDWVTKVKMVPAENVLACAGPGSPSTAMRRSHPPQNRQARR